MWRWLLGRFQVVYADCPWAYRNRNTGGSFKSGSAAKYPTLSLRELEDLSVSEIAAKDSILFLWATVPLLPEAFYLMTKWGFSYKTSIFWRKIMSLGLGFYFRGQVEILLMGIRGKISAFRCQKSNFYQSKALKHSHKPDYFYSLIEEVTPNMTRIELFATQKREGWTSLGYEIDGKDIREALSDPID